MVCLLIHCLLNWGCSRDLVKKEVINFLKGILYVSAFDCFFLSFKRKKQIKSFFNFPWKYFCFVLCHIYIGFLVSQNILPLDCYEYLESYRWYFNRSRVFYHLKLHSCFTVCNLLLPWSWNSEFKNISTCKVLLFDRCSELCSFNQLTLREGMEGGNASSMFFVFFFTLLVYKMHI